MVVEGKLGKLAGRHLMIDTASSPTILDKSVAKRLGLDGNRSYLELLNGNEQTTTSVLSSLSIGPVTANSLPVFVTNLSRLERDIGTRIDAIVGLDMLQASSFLIDYHLQRIVFGPVNPLPDSVPFETGPPFVTVRMEIEGEPLRLLVDTGASGLLLFSGDHNRLRWLPTLQFQSSSSIAGPFQRELVQVSNVRLGDVNLGTQSAFLVHVQKQISRDFDGLMGVPAIGITQIAFDFEHNILTWKN